MANTKDPCFSARRAGIGLYATLRFRNSRMHDRDTSVHRSDDMAAGSLSCLVSCLVLRVVTALAWLGSHDSHT